MHFSYVSLFPDLLSHYVGEALLARATADNLIHFSFQNPREFSEDSYRRVDSRPYGGGPGMLMQIAPLVKSLEKLESQHGESHRIYLSANGQSFSQQKAESLSKKKHISFVCGRYEGVDARITDFVHEEISVGQAVYMGGEVAALAITEAVARLIPGVLGNQESLEEESFHRGQKREAPQFTRPREFRGKEVPEVLLSGDHQKIKAYREGR